MTHRLLVRRPPDDLLRPGEVDDLERHLAEGSLLWLDVRTRDADEMDDLGVRFGFDPGAARIPDRRSGDAPIGPEGG